MGVTNSNKQISTQYIECDGTFEVLLALTAARYCISSNRYCADPRPLRQHGGKPFGQLKKWGEKVY